MPNTLDLKDLQYQIQSSICSNSKAADLLNLIADKPPITPSERIEIYQNAYQIRLTESLRDDFLLVEEALGEVEFARIIQEYISHHPSRTANLAEYSEGFPKYIYTHYPRAYKAAIMDWLEILVHHAPEPVDALTLGDIEAGKYYKIVCHPATHFQKIEKESLVGYRFQNEFEFLWISEPEHELLDFLSKERNLDDLMLFASNHEFSTTDLMSKLTLWIQKGIIYCKGDTK